MLRPADISAFLSRNPQAIMAELTVVRGSSPREAGAFMLVGVAEVIGTIGGGALEHMVIARGRQALREDLAGTDMDVPLGPEIGQCCGGRVTVAMRLIDKARAAELLERSRSDDEARPTVLVFGAGHVGRALARALALLPVRVMVADTRAEELAGLPPEVTPRVTAMPEALVRSAPAGSAYVIVTHDHALDFLIAAEALGREDSAYVGMIGSQTKKAKFSSWFKAEGGDAKKLNRLIMPIGRVESAGRKGSGDKRPEVIAALAAAEIMVHIDRREVDHLRARPVTGEKVDTVDGR